MSAHLAHYQGHLAARQRPPSPERNALAGRGGGDPAGSVAATRGVVLRRHHPAREGTRLAIGLAMGRCHKRAESAPTVVASGTPANDVERTLQIATTDVVIVRASGFFMLRPLSHAGEPKSRLTASSVPLGVGRENHASLCDSGRPLWSRSGSRSPARPPRTPRAS
jgi:hypothetical protein